MDNQLVSVGDIATILNISIRRVNQLVQETVIPPARGRKYDLIETVKSYVSWLQSKTVGQKNNSIDADLAEEKKRLTRAQADKAELEVAVLEGKLVQLADVEREYTDLVLKCRSRLLEMPGRLSHELSCMSDPVRIQEKLKSVINEALNELEREEGGVIDESGEE